MVAFLDCFVASLLAMTVIASVAKQSKAFIRISEHRSPLYLPTIIPEEPNVIIASDSWYLSHT
jgi:hypothetical protein